MTPDDPCGEAESDDRAAIGELVRTFFAAFRSGPDAASRLETLRGAFAPGATITRTCGSPPVRYDVDGFIAPRAELLSGGSLVDFREWELAGRTDLFGDIAQHFCSYAKEGVQDGVPFSGRGMKSLQFVRTADGWRITSVCWDDERDGVPLQLDQPAG